MELNKILERAVNLKNFLKGKQRVRDVAKYVAKHYRENVEPLGYKAFLVGVDREACAHYKKALDEFLPPEYSEVVFTGNNNDSKLLKEFHLDPKEERQIRKSFAKREQFPKILIVTEKLLTGYDAPVLYAMYLDKPMRDHTLLQAIARVNRLYVNEAEEMVKPPNDRSAPDALPRAHDASRQDAKFASTAGPGTACRAMMSGPVRAGREAAGWLPRIGLVAFP